MKNPFTWWLDGMRKLAREDGVMGLFMGAYFTLAFAFVGFCFIMAGYALFVGGVGGFLIFLAIMAFIGLLYWIYQTRDRA